MKAKDKKTTEREKLMASKAKIDCEVGGGKRMNGAALAGTFEKDQVLDSDRYWQKWPDLFEKVQGSKFKVQGQGKEKTERDAGSGESVEEGGDG